jgi:hypothetical protein
VKAPAWSALAAWVALGISLASLWYSVIRAWLRERKASPAADLDLLHYQTRAGWNEEVRVVVTNRGPALMRAVEVQVFDEDGKSLAMAEPDVTALWPKMPVEYLHPGQSLYLTLNRSKKTRTARGALTRCAMAGKVSSRVGLASHTIALFSTPAILSTADRIRLGTWSPRPPGRRLGWHPRRGGRRGRSCARLPCG